MPGLRDVLVRGSIAGACAGLLTALFHLLLTEPVLERAIALEGPGDGPVSREVQKYAGGPAGQILFGIAVGLLFGLVYRVLPSTSGPWRRAVGLAFCAWVVVALVPQVRYPASPPGVGDPETISTRTSAYLACYLLGLVVVIGGHVALRALQQRGWAEPQRQVLVVSGAVVAVAVGYALLPDAATASALPADIVWDFRIRALGGLTLLFAVLGTVFGLLMDRARPPADARDSGRAAVR
jgi:hypothetical protein